MLRTMGRALALAMMMVAVTLAGGCAKNTDWVASYASVPDNPEWMAKSFARYHPGVTGRTGKAKGISTIKASTGRTFPLFGSPTRTYLFRVEGESGMMQVEVDLRQVEKDRWVIPSWKYGGTSVTRPVSPFEPRKQPDQFAWETAATYPEVVSYLGPLQTLEFKGVREAVFVPASDIGASPDMANRAPTDAEIIEFGERTRQYFFHATGDGGYGGGSEKSMAFYVTINETLDGWMLSDYFGMSDISYDRFVEKIREREADRAGSSPAQ